VKMIISFPKSHFYILHWIFYILHFLSRGLVSCKARNEAKSNYRPPQSPKGDFDYVLHRVATNERFFLVKKSVCFPLYWRGVGGEASSFIIFTFLLLIFPIVIPSFQVIINY